MGVAEGSTRGQEGDEGHVTKRKFARQTRAMAGPAPTCYFPLSGLNGDLWCRAVLHRNGVYRMLLRQ